MLQLNLTTTKGFKVNIVTVIAGRFSLGKDLFREIRNVSFPLVDGTIGVNERGSYITVDGRPVRGFPKRNFKVFINDENDFTIGQASDSSTALDTAIASSVVRVPKAPIVITDEDIIASLSGSDDDAIKDRIRDRFFIMKQLAWAAADGDIKALVISGPPGVGKSHELMHSLEHDQDSLDVMQQLVDRSMGDPDEEPVIVPKKKPKVRYEVVSGRVTAGGLYELLYKYSDERSVLVLDDCDVFSDETSLDLLKRALDQNNKRVISWRTRSMIPSSTPDTFTFHGSVIFITNLDFENPKVKGSSLAPHIEAIMSRVYYLDLTMHTLREKFLRIEQVCVDDQLLEKIGLGQEQIAEVMAYFKQYITKFREVSIRTVQKIGTMRKLNEGEWEKMAAITTMKSSTVATLPFM